MGLYLGNTEIEKLYFGETEITKAYLGDTKIYPIEKYIIYDWVQCDDTTGYPHIPIGFNPNQSTLWEFEGDFARVANMGTDWTARSLFNKQGHSNYDSNYALRRDANGSNKIVGNYNSRDNSEGYAIKSDVTINIGEWHHFVLKAEEGITYGGSLIIDNTTNTYNYNTRGNAANKQLVLLYSESGKGYPCRFGEFKVKYNGNLVADLKPAKRDSDNIVGFYDIVRNTFYEPTIEGVTLLCGNGFESFRT